LLLLLMTMIYLSGFLIIGWLIFILSVVPFFLLKRIIHVFSDMYVHHRHI